jgi:hypothetical protein
VAPAAPAAPNNQDIDSQIKETIQDLSMMKQDAGEELGNWKVV